MASFLIKTHSIVVKTHPDPEVHSLEVGMIGRYQVIVKKDLYKTGDTVVYFPEDTIVPDDWIAKMGLQNRLAGNRKNRVKPIRLRGVFSEGLVHPMPDHSPGEDLTEVFQQAGFYKYIPAVPANMSGTTFEATGKTLKYEIENFKAYPMVLKPDEEVVFTEKLHGTWTCLGSYEGEAIVSSKGQAAKGFAYLVDEGQNDDLVYVKQWRADVDKITELAKRLDTQTVYVLGEIFGFGVQDLTYGLRDQQFRVFDIYVGRPRVGHYLSYDEMLKAVEGLFESVPQLYRGPFSEEVMLEYTDGESALGANVREGIVIRPVEEGYDPEIGRRILKSVSETYKERPNLKRLNKKKSKPTEYQ